MHYKIKYKEAGFELSNPASLFYIIENRLFKLRTPAPSSN